MLPNLKEVAGSPCAPCRRLVQITTLRAFSPRCERCEPATLVPTPASGDSVFQEIPRPTSRNASARSPPLGQHRGDVHVGPYHCAPAPLDRFGREPSYDRSCARCCLLCSSWGVKVLTLTRSRRAARAVNPKAEAMQLQAVRAREARFQKAARQAPRELFRRAATEITEART